MMKTVPMLYIFLVWEGGGKGVEEKKYHRPPPTCTLLNSHTKLRSKFYENTKKPAASDSSLDPN